VDGYTSTDYLSGVALEYAAVQSRRRAEPDLARATLLSPAIRDPHITQDRIGDFTLHKRDATVRLGWGSLAVDCARFGITGLGAHGNRLAQVVEVAIAIAPEHPIGQFDDIAVDARFDRSLNGGEVTGAIGANDVGCSACG
jgi:hypothetical protein